MVRGEQWLSGDAERQATREKPALALNSLVKVVNAVANREIMDRIVPRVYGRNKEDNGFAQVLDAASNWQRDVSETEHEETMAFRNCVTSGYGVMHKWWDSAGQKAKPSRQEMAHLREIRAAERSGGGVWRPQPQD
jgi:hypothetical protein